MKKPHRRIPAAKTAGPMYGVPISINNQTQSGVYAANESWLIKCDISWAENLTKSSLFADFEKCCFVHINRLIATIISAKVSSPFLSYQDVVSCTTIVFASFIFIAIKVKIEYIAINNGVHRCMALSDHWRCVSMPRCILVSANVTSMFQRSTNQLIIWIGKLFSSVLKKTSALFFPSGVLTS